MAFTARPHAPQQPTNGLGRGFESLGNSIAGIADRLEKRKEEEKREQTNAKAALTLWKANPELQKATGMDEHTFTGLPRLEQIATVQGGITALSLQQANAKAARERDEMENQQRFPDFARRISETGQAPGSVPSPVSNEEFDRRTAPTDFRSIMGAAAASGYRPREGTLDDLTRAATAGGEGVNSLFKPEELGVARQTAVPDTYFMPTSRGGGQVVIDPRAPLRPSGEKSTDEGTIEVPDQNDPVFGPRIRIPLKVAREKYPHLLKQLEGPAAPAAAPAAAAPPATGERVTVEKDGKKFTLPKAQLAEAQKQGYKLIPAK